MYFSILLRFNIERYYYVMSPFNTQANVIIQKLPGYMESFDGIIKQQIIFTLHVMPIEILKKLLNHPSVSVIKSFDKNSQEYESLVMRSESDIKIREHQIAALEQKLEGLRSTAEFVALNKGFESMKNRKVEEAKSASKSLKGLGLLMIGLIVAQLGFVYFNFDGLAARPVSYLFTSVPIVAMEVLLIYFFRVVLGNFNSIKAQILQLDLRVSLCQFIQNYVEYAKVVKEKDKGALEKFENLIFSGIVSADEKIPSTFDGLEQIGKIIESIKK